MTAGEIDGLRPPAAGRLLSIRREIAAMDGDELERAALCNAQVLAESCYVAGERAFASKEAVLEALTFREMERLLLTLGSGLPAQTGGAAQNPQFDSRRFEALQKA